MLIHPTTRLADPARALVLPRVAFGVGTPDASQETAAASEATPPVRELSKPESTWLDRWVMDPMLHGAEFMAFRPRWAARVYRMIGEKLMPDSGLPLFEPYSSELFPSLNGHLILSGHWMPSEAGYRQNGGAGPWVIPVTGAACSVLRTNCAKPGSMYLPLILEAMATATANRPRLGLKESEDIAAAVRYVKESYGVKSKQLYYMGHSMGAAGDDARRPTVARQATQRTPRSVGRYYFG